MLVDVYITQVYAYTDVFVQMAFKEKTMYSSCSSLKIYLDVYCLCYVRNLQLHLILNNNCLVIFHQPINNMRQLFAGVFTGNPRFKYSLIHQPPQKSNKILFKNRKATLWSPEHPFVAEILPRKLRYPLKIDGSLRIQTPP